VPQFEFLHCAPGAVICLRAPATIKGFEVMRMIRKRQCVMFEPGTAGERLFRFAG
jgi:hypothetical protein